MRLLGAALIVVLAGVFALMIGHKTDLKGALVIGGVLVVMIGLWVLDIRVERAKKAKLAAMSPDERDDYEAQALADRSW